MGNEDLSETPANEEIRHYCLAMAIDHQVTVLEARERIGGRVWTAQFGDASVDMGAMVVQHGQSAAWSKCRLGKDELGSCASSGRAWWLRATWDAQGERPGHWVHRHCLRCSC